MEETTMKVLVAMDESEVSLYALKWTLERLFPSTGAAPDQDSQYSLTLLHVQQAFQHYLFPAGPGPAAAFYAPTSVIDSVKKAQDENTAALFSRALRICEERRVKAVTMVLEGDPKDMICHAVDQFHPHLLVVGSRGLGKIKRALLGSVSDYCAHHCKCAVLIVKPQPKATTSTTA